MRILVHLYVRLVLVHVHLCFVSARFCGPASTVQVHCVKTPRLEFRTLGHAVHEVGERMVEFVLFPQQLALLEVRTVCVAGVSLAH